MKAKELCPICGGELEETAVKEDIWLGGELLVIENVHAKVCDKCGEKVVSYDELQRIDRVINEFNRGKVELKRITAYVASI
ncbi:MAG: type II toxin-antitoxin system MqsA family antitoxin [Methanophagales archaeon]|nr:type II toxin-antitoxin system MqsA family antitoxin [Methanophagales archaeon]